MCSVDILDIHEGEQRLPEYNAELILPFQTSAIWKLYCRKAEEAEEVSILYLDEK